VKRRAVCLDASGTILETIRPVGETYASAARRYGRDDDPVALDLRFREVWSRRSAAAPERSRVPLSSAEEKAWWKALVHEVFAAGEGFRDFDGFFDELHAQFADPGEWRVYPDVAPALARLRASGAAVALVSNWDARLEGLLGRLGLLEAFHVVVISGTVGVSKPDPGIFGIAVQGLGVDPAATVHIGDSLHDDVHGALQAGLSAVWLRRKGEAGDVPPGVAVATNLEEAVERALSR